MSNLDINHYKLQNEIVECQENYIFHKLGVCVETKTNRIFATFTCYLEYAGA
jgi:hypothetical protein